VKKMSEPKRRSKKEREEREKERVKKNKEWVSDSVKAGLKQRGKETRSARVYLFDWSHGTLLAHNLPLVPGGKSRDCSSVTRISLVIGHASVTKSRGARLIFKKKGMQGPQKTSRYRDRENEMICTHETTLRRLSWSWKNKVELRYSCLLIMSTICKTLFQSQVRRKIGPPLPPSYFNHFISSHPSHFFSTS
jgi:hypothetical protein